MSASGRETKYDPPAKFPAQLVECRHLYFFRLDCEDGKQRPYFYDIEIDEDNFTLQTFHGKPGKFMWKNKVKTYTSLVETNKAVATLVKGRKNFKNGPFTSTSASSRYGITSTALAAAVTVAVAGSSAVAAAPGAWQCVSCTYVNEPMHLACSLCGTQKASAQPAQHQPRGSKKRPHDGDPGDGGGGGGGRGASAAAASSSSSVAAMQKKRKASAMSGDAAASSSPLAASVLTMNKEELHAEFPFTSTLKFDAQRLWADKDHQTLSKPCKKAGHNLYGHSVIVGRNPKTGGPNFWVCGTKEEVIVPYNLKLKLTMTLLGRANHQSTDEEKARVAAMYRECELRGVGFKRPQR